MKTRGCCLCGAIAYAITATKDNMSHCYCGICRKTHGSLFGTYISVPDTEFVWEQGNDQVRLYESSPGFKRAFCPTCGSVVPFDNTEGQFAVPAGALEDDCGARPKSNIFTNAKAPWYDISNDLPRYDGYYPGTDRPTIALESRSAACQGEVGGSCQCGAVAFAYKGAPRFLWNCHCSRCRKVKGAAHATNVFVAVDDFRWIRGADDILVYRLPDTERFGHAFCRHCGSSLARKVSEILMNIPAGALDDPPGGEIKGHIFTANKAPWFEVTDDLPQYIEMPPPG